MNYEKIKEVIIRSKKILIISHINPDGDALGSTCGLYSAIYNNLRAKVEFVKALKESLSLYSTIVDSNSIMEASITNSLKLAGIKLKNNPLEYLD